jgi:uncharacterized protein (TIGR02145 family)
MKSLYFTIVMVVMLSLATRVSSQGVAISSDPNATPDPSALLDVQSTDKGVLVPRMTQAQRNMISNPATGLLIFQTDNEPGFYFNSGTPASPVWQGIAGSNDIWQLSGNDVYRINGNLGLGTDSPTQKLDVDGQLRIRGGAPGAGKVLTSDANGSASWETPLTLPSGSDLQTLRHDGTSWVADGFLRNSGSGLGVGTNPQENTQLHLLRPMGNYGAGYTNIFAHREGSPGNPANGGTFWGLAGVDAAIKGYSNWGNNFSVAVAGYGSLDYANSAAVIGSTISGNTFGALAFKDANSTTWAGFFNGNVNISGTMRIQGGNPGAGKVLTSNENGNASWESPHTLPSGFDLQTLRHDGTAWVANDFLRNNGTGLGIGINPLANTQLYLFRTASNYGADYANIYAERNGSSTPANGGTSWSRTGVDAAIKGFSNWGNNFSAAVAGYGYLDFANSAAVIGSSNSGFTYGALAFKDAGSILWAGFFQGNVNVTGTMRIQGGTPGTGKVLTSDANGNATWQAATSSMSCIDIDGNAYPTIVIGNQVWMAENLRVTKYRNGNPIPIVTGDAAWQALTSGAYCWYNNNQSANAKYGAMYNWYAVNDPRGLCPQGWRVPTNADWTTLINALGGTNLAGGKLKATSPLWQSPNGDATNSTGFSGLPGGFRWSWGLFEHVGVRGAWWTGTQDSFTGLVSSWYVYSTNGNAFHGEADQWRGLSVRCIRDN